jgi:hypothetical protein
MPEPIADRPVPPSAADDPALRTQALLYSFGELSEEEARRFEERLAQDQAAREALALAVQRCQRMAGHTPQGPGPDVRRKVLQRLRGTPSPAPAAVPPAAAVLPPARSERARPVVWALTGAAATLLVLAVGALAPGRVAAPRPQPQKPEPVAADPNVLNKPVNEAGETLDVPLEQIAEAWGSVPYSQHLTRTMQETQQRQGRGEERRLSPSEERINRLLRSGARDE